MANDAEPRSLVFKSPADKAEQEAGPDFRPRFGPDGLLVCVTVDHSSGDILMLAYMNDLALSETLRTGIVHYWSRSRGELWKKGETSGQLQTLVELRTDCDQDAIVASVQVGGNGGACHVGYRSCFYRVIRLSEDGERAILNITDAKLDN